MMPHTFSSYSYHAAAPRAHIMCLLFFTNNRSFSHSLTLTHFAFLICFMLYYLLAYIFSFSLLPSVGFQNIHINVYIITFGAIYTQHSISLHCCEHNYDGEQNSTNEMKKNK